MNAVVADKIASSTFDAYLGGDCQELLRDVEMMLGGAARASAAAPEVEYAIDFSEIFAFTHPDRTKREVQLFPRDPEADETQQVGINEYVLDRVFFGHKTSPILLIPYAVELESFIRTIEDEEVSGLIEAGRQLEGLKATPALQEILETRRSRPNSGLTDKELEAVLRTIEQHAPLLRLYLHDEGRSSVTRLKFLLANAKLRGAKELYVPQAELEEQVQNRWLEALIAVRGESRAFSCQVDARAMAQLACINRALRNQNRVVRLITRSPTMHRLFRSEREKYWSDFDPDMLCHPRAFLFQLDWLPTLSNGTEAIQTLVRLRDGLLFLQKSGALVQSEAGNAQELEANLRAIRHQWNVLANLVLSTETDTHRKSRSRSKNVTHAFAYQILYLVSHDSRIREEVHRRVQELGRDLRSGMEHLPYDAQLSPDTVTESFSKPLAFDEVHGKEPVALSPRSLKFVSYRQIQFYSPYIRKAAEKNPDAGVETISRFVKRKDAARGGEYERRLAMAYLLAVNGYWNLAESYCDLALSTAPEYPNVPRHEGHYLLALCKRIHEPTLERLRAGLRHLQEAQHLKAEGSPDPRYLTERAAIILAWLADASTRAAPDAPSVEEAISASRQALDLLPPKDGLRVTILNNLCYWHLGIDTPQSLDEARSYWQTLHATVNSIEPKRERWPSGVLDTFLWAEFKLTPTPDPRKLWDILSQFDRAMGSLVLADRDRRVMKGHRDAIQAALDNLR